MKFWQSLLCDIFIVGISYFCYATTKFEFTVIIMLGLILSNIFKLSYKPKIKPPTQIYTKSSRKFKI